MSTPNPAAVALGKRRWAGTTKAERTETMTELAHRRSTALTPEQRSEIAKKAAAASAKVRAKKKSRKKSSGGKS